MQNSFTFGILGSLPYTKSILHWYSEEMVPNAWWVLSWLKLAHIRKQPNVRFFGKPSCELEEQIMPHATPALLSSFNQRLDLVKPSAIRALDNEVSAIPDILKLTLGEPDFDVPEHIKQAAVRSIVENDSHYAASNGTLALRQAADGFLADSYGVDYDAES